MKRKRSLLRRIIIGVGLLLIFVAVFFLRTKYWNSKGKLAVVIDRGQEVVISLYDSKAGSRTDVIIPGNTQVLAAYNLGTWKLGSLWKLGSDENMGGSLITKTISMNFSLPVFAWWDSLSLGDKLRISIFSFLNRKSKNTVFLKETSYLKKTVFLDGENGYLVNKDVPEEVSSMFSDQEEFGDFLKAKIIDSTESFGVANKVGRIIETMGIKVAAISKGSGSEGDCKVMGKNKELVRKTALILGCSEVEIKDLSSFDLEIYLGNQY
ncbi:MAG: hypothetical protein NTV24_04120 [Candidatus Woesebacteria bacterium]|nr:hypothetical protein [Candidatus Woesebacteria bacterium]